MWETEAHQWQERSPLLALPPDARPGGASTGCSQEVPGIKDNGQGLGSTVLGPSSAFVRIPGVLCSRSVHFTRVNLTLREKEP